MSDKDVEFEGGKDDFDFDFDDGFDFDEAAESTDERTPVSSVVAGFKEKVISDELTYDKGKEFVKEALPDKISDTIDDVTDAYDDTVGDLNEIADELKPQAAALLKTGKQLLPGGKMERAADWLGDKLGLDMSSPSEKRESKGKLLNEKIVSDVDAIFGEQQQLELKKLAVGKMDRAVDQKLAGKRHTQMTNLLQMSQAALVDMSSYNKTINMKYQQKSLELRFRSMYLLKDLTIDTLRSNKATNKQLESIVKNTALPEFVKIKMDERFAEMGRDAIAGKLGESIFGEGSWFKRKAMATKNFVIDKATAVKDTFGMIEIIQPQLQMMAEMRKEGGTSTNAMKSASSFGTGLLADVAKEQLLIRLKESEAYNELSLDAQIKLANSPRAIENFLRRNREKGNKGDADLLEKIGGKISGFVEDILKYNQTNVTIKSDEWEGSDPAIFTNNVSRSITRVIPTFLSHILREITSIRTGNDNADMMVYNMSRDELITETDSVKNAVNLVDIALNRDSYQDKVDELMKQIDPSGMLSTIAKDELRKQISENVIRENEGGVRINTIDDLGDSKFLDGLVNQSVRDEIKALSEQVIGKERQVDIIDNLSDLGDSIPNIRPLLSQLIDERGSSIFSKIGLIERDGNAIDLSLDGLKAQLNTRGALADTDVNEYLVDRPDNIKAPRAMTDTDMSGDVTPITNVLLSIDKQLDKYFPDDEEKEKLEKQNNSRHEEQTGLLNKLVECCDAQLATSKENMTVDISSDTKGFYGQSITLLEKIEKNTKDSIVAMEQLGVVGFREAILGVLGTGASTIGKVSGNITKAVGKATGTVTKKVTGGLDWLTSNEGFKTTKDAISGFVGSGMGLLGKFFNYSKDQLDKTIKDRLPAGWDMLLDLFNKGKNKLIKLKDKVLNRAMDIYVPGRDGPVLYKDIMKIGGYYDQKTGDPIKSIKDIKGPVVDAEGNVLLTLDMIKDGIYDVFGNKVTGLWGKIKSLFGNTTNTMKNILGKGNDKSKGLLSKINPFEGFKPFLVTTADTLEVSMDISRRTNSILEDILKLLDKRMPGEPMFNDRNGDGIRDGDEKRKVKVEEEDTPKKESKEREKRGMSLGTKLTMLLGGAGAIATLLGNVGVGISAIGTALTGYIGWRMAKGVIGVGKGIKRGYDKVKDVRNSTVFDRLRKKDKEVEDTKDDADNLRAKQDRDDIRGEVERDRNKARVEYEELKDRLDDLEDGESVAEAKERCKRIKNRRRRRKCMRDVWRKKDASKGNSNTSAGSSMGFNVSDTMGKGNFKTKLLNIIGDNVSTGLIEGLLPDNANEIIEDGYNLRIKGLDNNRMNMSGPKPIVTNAPNLPAGGRVGGTMGTPTPVPTNLPRIPGTVGKLPTGTSSSNTTPYKHPENYRQPHTTSQQPNAVKGIFDKLYEKGKETYERKKEQGIFNRGERSSTSTPRSERIKGVKKGIKLSKLLKGGAKGLGIGLAFDYVTSPIKDHLSRNDVSLIRKSRFMQYGFGDSTKQHYYKLVSLETMIVEEGWMTRVGKNVQLDLDSMDTTKVVELFELDVNDNNKLYGFSEWLKKQFKPVYDRAMSACSLLNIDINADALDAYVEKGLLGSISPLESEQAVQILRIMRGVKYEKFSELYIPERVVLNTNDTTINELSDKIASIQDYKTGDVVDTTAKVLDALDGKFESRKEGFVSYMGEDTKEKVKVDSLTRLESIAPKVEETGIGNWFKSTMPSFDGIMDDFDTGKGFKNKDAVSLVKLIRYHQYGFDEKLRDQYHVLEALENMIHKEGWMSIDNQKRVVLNVAQMDVKRIIALFGISTLDREKIRIFSTWLGLRFKPVYEKAMSVAVFNRIEPNAIAIDKHCGEDKNVKSVRFILMTKMVDLPPIKFIMIPNKRMLYNMFNKLNERIDNLRVGMELSSVDNKAIKISKAFFEGKDVEEEVEEVKAGRGFIANFVKDNKEALDTVRKEHAKTMEKLKDNTFAKNAVLDKAGISRGQYDDGVFTLDKKLYKDEQRAIAEQNRIRADKIRRQVSAEYKATWLETTGLDLQNTEEADTPEVKGGTGGLSAPANKPVSSGNVTNMQMAAGGLKDGSNGMQYITPYKNPDIKNIQGDTLKLFLGMVQEYGEKTGKKIQVNSGYRDVSKQRAMYLASLKDPKRKGKVGKPGGSMHNYGLAIDINTVNVKALEKHGLLRKYGFICPLHGESWHIEPIGIQFSLHGIRNGSVRNVGELVRAGVGRGGGGAGFKKHRKGSPIRRDTKLCRAIYDAGTSTLKGIPAKQESTSVNMSAADLKPEKPGKATGVTVSRGTQGADGGTGVSGGIAGMVASQQADSTATRMGTANISSGKSDEGLIEKIKGRNKKDYPTDKDGVKKVVAEAAQATGLNVKMLQAVAAQESGFRYNAKGTGAARGVMQMLPDTWKELLGQHGKKYGYDNNTSVYNSRANALMGAEYIKSNFQSLKSIVPNPGAVEAYMILLLGPTGARRMLKALRSNPNASSHSMGNEKAARNNPGLFGSVNNPKTFREAYATIANKLERNARGHGVKFSIKGVNNDGVSASEVTIKPPPSTGSSPTIKPPPTITPPVKKPASIMPPSLQRISEMEASKRENSVALSPDVKSNMAVAKAISKTDSNVAMMNSPIDMDVTNRGINESNVLLRELIDIVKGIREDRKMVGTKKNRNTVGGNDQVMKLPKDGFN